MLVTKYTVQKPDNIQIDELLAEITEDITNFVEQNLDVSATIIKNDLETGVTIKLLKLNEHSN